MGSTMNCKQAQEALNDRLGSDKSAQPDDLIAHLASCPACRAQAEQAERLSRCLASMRTQAAAIPADVLAANEHRIIETVRHTVQTAKPVEQSGRPASTSKSASKRASGKHKFSSPRIHPALLWSIVGAAAALVMVFGIFVHDHVSVPASVVAQSTSSVPVIAKIDVSGVAVATNSKPDAKNQDPITLAWMKKEFGHLKSAKECVSGNDINRVVNFLTTGSRTLDEKVMGWKLLVEAYAATGEADRSVNAFGKYLDVVEQRDGREKAIQVGYWHAGELFYRNKDYIHGLACYDLLATHYPDTDAPAKALLTMGRYYCEQKMWAGAEKAYRRVVEEFPGTQWEKKAQMALWTVLWRRGKGSESVAILDEFAKENVNNEKDRLYADSSAAFVLQTMGVAHYPEAIQRLKKVMESNPDSPTAKSANKMIALMTEKMTEGSGASSL